MAGLQGSASGWLATVEPSAYPTSSYAKGGVKCISAYLVKVNNSISQSFTGKGCFPCVAGCRSWQSATRFHVLCVVIDTFCDSLSWSNSSFPCLQCKMYSVEPLLMATSQERPFMRGACIHSCFNPSKLPIKVPRVTNINFLLHTINTCPREKVMSINKMIT